MPVTQAFGLGRRVWPLQGRWIASKPIPSQPLSGRGGDAPRLASHRALRLIRHHSPLTTHHSPLTTHHSPSLLGFLRVDEAVAVGVEFLEHVPRAEELLPGQVAVEVAIHALEPDRADRRPRLGDRPRDRRLAGRSRAEQLEAAADDLATAEAAFTAADVFT